METIVYVTIHYGLSDQPFRIQAYNLQTYRLLRAGVSPAMAEWLSGKDVRQRLYTEAESQKGLIRRLVRKRQLRRESARMTACQNEFWDRVWEDRTHTYFVCETPVALAASWLFDGYGEAKWAELLLPYATLPYLVIWGNHDSVRPILQKLTRRLKSVDWYLTARQYTEETEALTEELYEEYGLPVMLHIEGQSRERNTGESWPAFPVVVLDWEKHRPVPLQKVGKGSIWLDMTAEDAKMRRAASLKGEIAYFSLKKLWKQL